MTATSRTRVLFISGREPEYIRNRVLLAALQAHHDVAVLTPAVRGTVLRTLLGLVRLIASRPRADVYVAGFYAQPLAIALALLGRKPIIVDAYVSTYDTLCEDRRWFKPRSPAGRLAFWLDRRSCQVAARAITDTHAHVQYFANTFDLPPARFEPIYVGCDETLFHPREASLPDPQRFDVFYYGAFLPLHGTETIIQAAALLRDRPQIRFTLGGDGMRRAAVEKLIAYLALDNVELVGWIPMDDLPGYIARASICLGGHFSAVPKAARVISTKTFQFLAMGKPTIVADNPATRELFAPGEHVWMVPMDDPAALAEAIVTLAADPALQDRIAAAGRQLYGDRLATHVIADQLARIVEQVICTSAS